MISSYTSCTSHSAALRAPPVFALQILPQQSCDTFSYRALWTGKTRFSVCRFRAHLHLVAHFLLVDRKTKCCISGPLPHSLITTRCLAVLFNPHCPSWQNDLKVFLSRQLDFLNEGHIDVAEEHAMLRMTFCAYHVVMVMFLGRVCHSLAVFFFLFLGGGAAFYFPSVRLHLCCYLLQLTIHMFYFNLPLVLIWHRKYHMPRLYSLFLLPSVPSLPHSCSYGLTHKASVSAASTSELACKKKKKKRKREKTEMVSLLLQQQLT